MPVDGKRARDARRQLTRGSEALRSEDVVDAERDAQVPGLQDLRLSSRARKLYRTNQVLCIAFEIKVARCNSMFFLSRR